MRLLLVLVFGAMVLRLVQVQEFGSVHYSALSRAQLTQSVSVPSVRGGIYDRNGEVLAETVTRQTVVADPRIIKDPTTVAAALSPLLGIPAATLRADLTEPSGFVYLAHRVPDAVATAVAKMNLNGINLVPESQRVVPVGRLAQPVVGTVGLERRRSVGHGVPVPVAPGRSGRRHRHPGVARRRGPAQRRTCRPPPYPGTGIELTLDESVQYVTEQALAAEIVASHATSGTAVIMDVKTGDILAMANLDAAGRQAGGAAPSTGSATLTAKVAAAPDTSGATLVAQSDTLPSGVVEAPSNSAVTQVYEPGSVFKLVTFSAALADAVITPNTPLSVPAALPDGEVHVPRRRGTRDRVADRHPDPRPVVQHRHHRGGARAWGRPDCSNQISALGFGTPDRPRHPR